MWDLNGLSGGRRQTYIWLKPFNQPRTSRSASCRSTIRRGIKANSATSSSSTWLAAAPPIASPVGANKDIVVEGQTGFLAASDEDWFTALQTLKNNPKQAAAFGKAGRERVEQHYSLNAVLPKLADVIQTVSG